MNCDRYIPVSPVQEEPDLAGRKGTRALDPLRPGGEMRSRSSDDRQGGAYNRQVTVRLAPNVAGMPMTSMRSFRHASVTTEVATEVTTEVMQVIGILDGGMSRRDPIVARRSRMSTRMPEMTIVAKMSMSMRGMETPSSFRSGAKAA